MKSRRAGASIAEAPGANRAVTHPQDHALHPPKNAPQPPKTTPQTKRPITGGAKFIAFYVLLGSFAGARRWDGVIESLGDIRVLVLILSGFAGGALLLRRHRYARPAFAVWTLMLAAGVVQAGPDSEPLWFRLAIGALGGIILLLADREIGRNLDDRA